MGGGGGGSYTQKCAGTASDSSKFEQIMVRFRPIAPKPAVGGTAEVVFAKQTRQKRRYVKSKNKKRVVSEEENNIISSSDPSSQVVVEEEEVVTLSLLPETPVSFNTTSSHLDLTPIHEPNPLVQMMQMQMQQLQLHQNQSNESVVIMECVERIGSSEMVDLENDTCPGFISDGYDRVWWTNQAYRMMVGSDMVRVVMKDRFPVTWGSAFVCRVRLQYTLREEKKSMIVPCDVWKINGGNFAWRLDVQAALSLGR